MYSELVRYFESCSYNSVQCDNYSHRLTLKTVYQFYGDIATSTTLEGPYKNKTEMQKQNCFPKSLRSLHKQKKAKIGMLWEPKMRKYSRLVGI